VIIYPLDYIFATINNKIKSLSHKYNPKRKNNIQGNNTANNHNLKRLFTILYYNGISEKFKRLSYKFDLNIAYKSINKLNKFIKTGKDILKKENESNVIYKINCIDYDLSYVGQIKRKLELRKADINKARNLLSIVSSHHLNEDHVLDWNNVLILKVLNPRELSYYKRIISEMIYIKKQKSGLNKQSDKLPELYLPLLTQYIISHLQSLLCFSSFSK